MKRILLTAYTSFNVGDDLFLKILFERYPNHFFVLFTSDERYVLHLKKYDNVRVEYFSFFQNFIYKIIKKLSPNSNKLLALIFVLLIKNKFIRKCDAYLEIGGSIFIQKANNLTFKEYKNKYLISFFKRKPSFYLGANWGPCFTQKYKLFYENIFRSVTDVCFRDKCSFNEFVHLSNIRYASDIVFQLKLPTVEKEIGSIGFSVINLSNRKDLAKYESIYIDTIVSLIILSLSEKRNVYLISFCKSEGDEIMIDKIVSQFAETDLNRINVLLYSGDLDTFLAKYNKIESIFASRFHSMILGMISCQKLFPIVYSNKMSNVLHDAHFKGEYCLISDLEHCSIKKMYDSINKYAPVPYNDEKKSAEKQFLKLDEFLNL